jgi:signal transduction histidine kinase
MLINLIRNSIQAKASKINIELSAESENSIINISDDGNGISPEIQNKIFEANFTTKEKGLGLGLKLIKRFLENTNGEIKLISSTTAGTIFKIKIPLKSTKQKA